MRAFLDALKLLWKISGRVPASAWIAIATLAITSGSTLGVFHWKSAAVERGKIDTRDSMRVAADSIARVSGRHERAQADSIATLDTIVAGQRKTLKVAAGETKTLANTVDQQAQRLRELAHSTPSVTHADSQFYALADSIARNAHALNDSVGVLNVRVTALDDSLTARDKHEATRRIEQAKVMDSFAKREVDLRDQYQREVNRPKLTPKKVFVISAIAYGTGRTIEYIAHRLRNRK